MLTNIFFDIGVAIASSLAKEFLGDNWATTAISKGFDKYAENFQKALAEGKDEDEIEKLRQIGDRILERIRPVIAVEYKGDDYTAVTYEFMDSLVNSKVTGDLLVNLSLNQKLIFDHFKEENKNRKALSSFSAVELKLYWHLIELVCQELANVANIFVDFEISVLKEQLQGQRKILNLLLKLFEKTSEDDLKFEKKYCIELAKQLDKLEMFGIRRVDEITRQQSLSVAYITLDVEYKVEEDETKSKKSKKSKQKIISQDSPVEKVLKGTRRLLVVGDPGSGKTTLLRWIAIQTARKTFPSDLQEWNNNVPFFIKLRECIDIGFPELESFPSIVLKMMGGKPQNWVHMILEQGRGVVLVDGVDELPVTIRSQMLERLSQLVSIYPFSRFIVTSRPSAIKDDIWIEWKDWIENEKFQKAVLQPMSKARIDIFIDKWFQALNRTISNDEESYISPDTEGLKRLLRKRLPLYRLAANPLLCAMVCALYNESGETLPSERIQLYSECVEMLLQRRDEVRKIKIDDYPDIPFSRKNTLAQDLAWWMMQNGYSNVDFEKAERFLDQKLISIGIQDSISGKDIRRFFLERAGILAEETLGKLSFAHRTFQEYLAAKSAVAYFLLDFLLTQVRDDQWRETIILACGEARPRERGEFLRSLIEHSKTASDRNEKRGIALLALACLETCIAIEPAEIRYEVIDWAKNYFPPRDAAEAQSVAKAGDLAVNLLSYNKTLDPRILATCINSLAQIGTTPALEVISEYASDSRPAVVKAIGNAMKFFDETEYLRKVLTKAHSLVLTDIENDQFLAELINLEDFKFHSSQAFDLSRLKQLTRLRKLSIWGTRLANFTAISSLVRLTELYLYNTGIYDLVPLEELTNLVRLDVHQTNIEDLSPLSNLKKLEFLDIRGTKVIDLSPLTHLTNLKELYLDVTKDYDILPLVGLEKLTIIKRGSLIIVNADY